MCALGDLMLDREAYYCKQTSLVVNIEKSCYEMSNLEEKTLCSFTKNLLNVMNSDVDNEDEFRSIYTLNSKKYTTSKIQTFLKLNAP